TVTLTFLSTEDRNAARSLISRDFPDFEYSNRDAGRGASLVMTMSDQAVRELQDYAVNQNLTTLRNRVDELGVAEPMVQRQGPNQIVVELPGVQDTAAAKRVVGATANLEFRLEARPDTTDAETDNMPIHNDPTATTDLMRDMTITGDSV